MKIALEKVDSGRIVTIFISGDPSKGVSEALFKGPTVF